MSHNTLYEFKCKLGQRVQLIDIDRPGLVTGVMRDSDSTQYRVVWWWDGVRRSEWLHGAEFNLTEEKRT